jgi:peptidase M28-like protein
MMRERLNKPSYSWKVKEWMMRQQRTNQPTRREMLMGGASALLVSSVKPKTLIAVPQLYWPRGTDWQQWFTDNRDDDAVSIQERAARLIQAYDSHGIHRTGTRSDNTSAAWLAAQMKECSVKAALESFTLDRVDPLQCQLECGGRRFDGLPIFDAAFTSAEGVRGRLGLFGSDADIGLLELPPNAESSPEYEARRRASTHRALVFVTKGARPGLSPINAPKFSEPYGAPILQVGSEYGDWLKQQARANAEALLVAEAKRTKTKALNVLGTIKGTDPRRAPLVVMTPRSGWWQAASERGGGLVCWLEVMRVLARNRPARNVHFIASSGHELGHLGLDTFLGRRPQLMKEAHAWIHFGANIGAAQEHTNRLQASSDELENLAVSALTEAGLQVHTKVKRGTVPLGEAGNIHRGGGRYLSLLGTNAHFHHPSDRWPQAVNVALVAQYVAAVSAIAIKLAG